MILILNDLHQMLPQKLDLIRWDRVVSFSVEFIYLNRKLEEADKKMNRTIKSKKNEDDQEKKREWITLY